MDEDRDEQEPTVAWNRWPHEEPTVPGHPVAHEASESAEVRSDKAVPAADDPHDSASAGFPGPSYGAGSWSWGTPPPPPPPRQPAAGGPGYAFPWVTPASGQGSAQTPGGEAGGSWSWGPPPGTGMGGWGYPPGQYAPPSRPGRTGTNAVSVVLVVLLLVVVAMGAGFGIGHLAWRTTNGGSVPPTTTPGSGSFPFGSGGFNFGSGSGSNSTASGGPADAAAIASGVDPALVDVNTTLGYAAEEAAGTGIVLTSTGEVLTNNHVIDGATSISVTDIGNGQVYGATIVGYDRSADVAVLQLRNASGLKVASIGNSATVHVGEAVVGIGNAGGVGGTPSVAGGSVTALNQNITATEQDGGNPEKLTGLIQVNADIQPGDSGGPLVNSAGKVLGMDTAASAGFSFQGSDASQGYAIPINTAISVARMIESGHSTASVHIGPTGFLGIQVTATNSGVAGAQIYEVEPGAPAAVAGLAAGDVITSLDGRSVSSPEGLTTLIQLYHPGEAVRVGWTDTTGGTHTTVVHLGTGPAA